jgi:hypothetical protein
MERSMINELILKRDDLKSELRHIDHELADAVLRYEGTLQDALKDRLVRLNFSAPVGFYKYLHKK